MATEVITVMEITRVMEIISDMARTATTMTLEMVASQTGLIPLPTTMTLSSETSVITSTTMGMATNPIKLDKVKEAATSTTSHTGLEATMRTAVREDMVLMTIDL